MVTVTNSNEHDVDYLKTKKEIHKSVFNFTNLAIVFLMGIFSLYNYLLITQDKIQYFFDPTINFRFRSQLLYNLTGFNQTFTFNLFQDLAFEVTSLILLFALILHIIPLIIIFLGYITPKANKSQFILRNSSQILFLFGTIQVIITMELQNKLPLGLIFEEVFLFLEENLDFILDIFKEAMNGILSDITQIMLLFHPIIIVLAFGLVSYKISKNSLLTISVMFMLLLINGLGFWEETINTISLILTATVICVLIGVPLGIIVSKSDGLDSLVRPVLDFMQTMPAFVYLIPVIVFFGIGFTAGLIATIIFALPPAVRLTNLGLRQVPVELIEVSESYGTTWWQKLVKVELPVAFPTIMAGVNQVIMLSLSMVVIAALIGTPGLGVPVVIALNRLDLSLAFSAGFSIVLFAIILDRVTASGIED